MGRFEFSLQKSPHLPLVDGLDVPGHDGPGAAGEAARLAEVVGVGLGQVRGFGGGLGRLGPGTPGDSGAVGQVPFFSL